MAGQLAPNQEPGELPRRRKSGFVYQGSFNVTSTSTVGVRLAGSKTEVIFCFSDLYDRNANVIYNEWVNNQWIKDKASLKYVLNPYKTKLSNQGSLWRRTFDFSFSCFIHYGEGL